jgi:hypothetical protein
MAFCTGHVALIDRTDGSMWGGILSRQEIHPVRLFLGGMEGSYTAKTPLQLIMRHSVPSTGYSYQHVV